ncbi:PTS sugar transporter subunit IIC [Amphibacillus sp. Q70]|uniref:PTS sugar transporter subunit IIC n=1 Tax=Amphibacillus sp. Q70 TaxID=3453416 RepID=UPI003F85D6FF
MNKIIYFLENKFAPKMNRFAENPWIQLISSAIMLVLPTILLGSIISIYDIINLYLKVLPDISPIHNFSFGLYALILSFLVGFQGMKKLRHEEYKICAGIVGLSTFLMLLKPEIVDGIISIEFSRLGPKGILISFLGGLLATIIIHNYAKLDPFKNNNTIPEFLIRWLNQIIPTFIALLITTVLIYTLNLDIFTLVMKLFSPISVIGQTLPGFIFICFTPALLYSLGISSWLLSPVYTPIMLEGIAQNIEAVSAGLDPTFIVTQETIFVGFVWIGGMGATLPLVLLMMKAKTKKLRTMGKVYLLPSLFNINEPVIFGTPVAFNPYLMLPMWLNGIVGPIIVWIFMRSGWVNIPSKLLTGVKLPMPISSVLTTMDWRAIILWAVLLIAYTAIWYPFFKAFDNQSFKEKITMNN